MTGRVVRPLILAQALTCNTFLWGLSRLCLSNLPWELSQDRPRPPARSMGVAGRFLWTQHKPEKLQKGKVGQTAGVYSQEWGVSLGECMHDWGCPTQQAQLKMVPRNTCLTFESRSLTSSWLSGS